MSPPTRNSPRSSDTFEAILEPDDGLRRLLLLCGVGLLLAGCGLIALLPFEMPARLLLLLAWCADSAVELRRQQRGFARVGRLTVTAGGEFRAAGPGMADMPVSLQSGSVILRRAAWLRLRFPDGTSYGEPVIEWSGRQSDWARFRLIWQQNRQAFGCR